MTLMTMTGIMRPIFRTGEIVFKPNAPAAQVMASHSGNAHS
jgi:hypothetical protein